MRSLVHEKPILDNRWTEVKSFKGMGKVVNGLGRKSDTYGNRYKIIAKYERDCTGFERAIRIIGGIIKCCLILPACTNAKGIKKSFTDTKKKIHLAAPLETKHFLLIKERIELTPFDTKFGKKGVHREQNQALKNLVFDPQPGHALPIHPADVVQIEVKHNEKDSNNRYKCELIVTKKVQDQFLGASYTGTIYLSPEEVLTLASEKRYPVKGWQDVVVENDSHRDLWIKIKNEK